MQFVAETFCNKYTSVATVLQHKIYKNFDFCNLHKFAFL